MKCQATFKKHCQFPKCDCDRDTDDPVVGSCMALWVLSGKVTEEWNGDRCDCEIIQGNYNCKLNPF